MRPSRLLIAILAAVLLVVVAAAFLLARQRPPQSSADINRGFPQTASQGVKAPVAAPAVATPSTARSPTPTSSAKGTLYIEPDAGFAWLYTLIHGAEHTVDMTMYELIDTTFSGDLVAACQRGVRVRVILDQSLEKVRNTPAYTQLNSAGANCSAAWSNPQFQATHEKSLVIDGATAVILTLNLVSQDYTSTRDLALVETDAADIAAIEATFNTDLNATTDLSYQPGAGDNLIWSPTTAQPELLGIINKAAKTLLVENEEMGAANIVQALEAACKRHVAVEIAMTDTNPSYHANYTALEKAGCGVHIGANDPTTLYIHAKAIVADLGTARQIGYLGSINFSVPSMTENRELGLYLRDANLLSQISSTVAGDYAQFPAYP